MKIGRDWYTIVMAVAVLAGSGAVLLRAHFPPRTALVVLLVATGVFCVGLLVQLVLTLRDIRPRRK